MEQYFVINMCLVSDIDPKSPQTQGTPAISCTAGNNPNTNKIPVQHSLIDLAGKAPAANKQREIYQKACYTTSAISIVKPSARDDKSDRRGGNFVPPPRLSTANGERIRHSRKTVIFHRIFQFSSPAPPSLLPFSFLFSVRER